jgi:tetratricopeptide (TPR) repeat protein
MRLSWRIHASILMLALWTLAGCHQTPGDKSVQDLRPIQQKPGETAKQQLSATDIVLTGIAKAEAAEKAGKTGDAMALYREMQAPGSNHAALATIRLGILYENSDDLDRAEDEYRRLLQLNPKDAVAFTKLGDLYARRTKWAIAEQLFEQALRIQPNNASARSGLALALAQDSRYDRSFEEYSRILSRAEACCAVAFVMKSQGKYREAAEAYQTALTFDPSLQSARQELAQLRQMRAVDPPSGMLTNHKTGQKGVVELEQAPTHPVEGINRFLMQRPTLPPMTDLDRDNGDWKSSGKQR